MDASSFFSGLARDRENGKSAGVYSVCSANPIVLEASMDHARRENRPLLIESTSNQVNQYGGYTGMRPGDFAAFVRDIASRSGFDGENLILGGDHLGPLVWKDMPEDEAMKRAAELVGAYVEAGFTKIHLDTSMRLSCDPSSQVLPDDIIAERGASLCAVAEEAYKKRARLVPASKPVYVIGSEVPVPGGAQEEKSDGLTPTSPSDFRASYEAFERAFERHGLEDAWGRTVAFVVQPGVEFNGETIFDYDRGAASELCEALRNIGRPLVFEGHSADYQRTESLSKMVEDGVAILKVGPGLTFAMREGLIALEHIERELAALHSLDPSNFSAALESAMMADDSNWKGHYHGDAESLRLQRRYSFFDRARYYLPVPEVDLSVKKLLGNLARVGIGLSLLSQYLPRSFEKARGGRLSVSPMELLKDCVREALSPYSQACAGEGNPRWRE
ncbi:MAG: class II D-tagatose-bisphosphate aldolase, non-catalytic subunit [Synergistaceae bacterium]|nr:class II D-tagatose-bisphosphate aldolase, non-catalytic subunit [Synergistaceae bacterium]